MVDIENAKPVYKQASAIIRLMLLDIPNTIFVFDGISTEHHDFQLFCIITRRDVQLRLSIEC